MMDSFLHMIRSLRYSLEGLSRCFRDEIAFRQECILAIPHFAGVLMLPLTWEIKLYLAAVWFVLAAVELLNTAVEAVVNLASPQKHDLAKKAKDVASAAVFFMLILLGISWIVVLCNLCFR